MFKPRPTVSRLRATIVLGLVAWRRERATYEYFMAIRAAKFPAKSDQYVANMTECEEAHVAYLETMMAREAAGILYPRKRLMLVPSVAA